jgi:hypothetical protein
VNRAPVSHDAPGDLDRLDAPSCSSETVLAGSNAAEGDGAQVAVAARCTGLIDSTFTSAREGISFPSPSAVMATATPRASSHSSAAAPAANTTPSTALLTLCAARAATRARGQNVGDNTGAGSAWTGTGGRRPAA